LKDERKDTAGEPRIRAATAADVPVIGQIVEQAYRHYIPRIGKPPGPMLDNYDARVSEGVVWVIGEPPSIVGIVVLLPRPEYLLLDNIAVAPARQYLCERMRVVRLGHRRPPCRPHLHPQR